MWLPLWVPATAAFKNRVRSETRLLDNTILDDQGCESLEELLLENDWRAAVDVRVYEVCQLRRASLFGDNPLFAVFCEALRLNRPGRNAKTLRDLREEVQCLLQRYALEDIDFRSPRLRCFVLEELSLLNWVYNSRAPLVARDLWRERQYCLREPSCRVSAVRVSEVDKAVLRRDSSWLSAHGVLYGGAAEVVDAADEAARHALEFEERGEVMKLLSVEKPVRRSRRGTRSAAAAARRQQQRKISIEKALDSADGVLVEAAFAARWRRVAEVFCARDGLGGCGPSLTGPDCVQLEGSLCWVCRPLLRSSGSLLFL